MEFIAKVPFNSYLSWHFYFIISQLVIFGSLRLATGTGFAQWIVGLKKPVLESEGNASDVRAWIFSLLGLVNLAFVLNIVGRALELSFIEFAGDFSYAICLLFIAMWVVVNLLVYNFGFWLTEENKIFLVLKYSYYRFLHAFGIFGLPVNLLLIFLPLNSVGPVNIMAISLIFLLLLIRVFQGVNTALRRSISIWYIILYLCALEITPLICLVKAIS